VERENLDLNKHRVDEARLFRQAVFGSEPVAVLTPGPCCGTLSFHVRGSKVSSSTCVTEPKDSRDGGGATRGFISGPFIVRFKHLGWKVFKCFYFYTSLKVPNLFVFVLNVAIYTSLHASWNIYIYIYIYIYIPSPEWYNIYSFIYLFIYLLVLFYYFFYFFYHNSTQ